MKKLYLLLATASLTLSIQTVSRAAFVTGSIFCDANQDGVLDNGDIALQGITVVITNETGSFSNSAVSAADGSFKIHIPDFSSLLETQDPLAQVYIETLAPASLPAGSIIVLPTAVTNITSTPAYFISFAADQTNLIFTSGTGNSTTGDWLINDPECGVSAGTCKVSGTARIKGEETGDHKLADHEFGGMIVSGSPQLGQWRDVSHNLRLMFESTSVQSVICGTNRSIDFSGTGTLTSAAPKNRGETNVSFTAEVENLTSEKGNKPAAAYYLRVFAADGTTLELVSTDPANPTDVAPVPATSDHLRMQTQ